jgi:hypothetical protein
MIFDAAASALGDLASAITQPIVEWIVRKFDVPPSRWMRWPLQATVFIVVFIPVAMVVLGALLYAGVMLINAL